MRNTSDRVWNAYNRWKAKNGREYRKKHAGCHVKELWAFMDILTTQKFVEENGKLYYRHYQYD